MSDRNPYAPPRAAVHDVAAAAPAAGDDVLVPNGRRRPASHGLVWIAASWRLFRERPGLWIVAVLLGYGAPILLSIVPWLNVVTAFVSPLLTAGLAAIAHAQYRREPVGLERLLAGLERAPSLLLIGAAYLAAWGLCIAVLVALDGPIWIQIATGSDDPTALEGRMLMLLGYFTMMMVISLLIAFAPALVLLNRLPPSAALRMSVTGSLKNVLPGLVCAATFLAIMFFAVLPLGLGLLVALPLVAITLSYTAYSDVFMEPAPET